VKPDSEILTKVVSGKTTTVFYKYKFSGKDLYFEDNLNKAMVATVVDGKVLGATFYLVSPFSNYQKSTNQLQPITNLDNASLLFEDYVVEASPTNPNTQVGELTGQNIAVLNLKAALKKQDTAFFYYIDNKASKSYILPALLIDGNYIDDLNNTGGIRVVVVNQNRAPG